jgi:hypothetical protein
MVIFLFRKTSRVIYCTEKDNSKISKTSYTRESVGLVLMAGIKRNRGRKKEKPFPATSHYDAPAALWLCRVGGCSFLNLGKDIFEYFA